MEGPSKITIILTVYNNKNDILKAVESVIVQTHKNWELIIVDDNSTDGTSETIQKFIEFLSDELRSKIIVIKNNINYGTYVSANIALQKSSGKYVIRLDSDDTYDPRILEKQANILDNGNYLACNSSYERNGNVRKNTEITFMYNIKIIDVMGYYDSTRIGGDSEFIERFKIRFGEKFIFTIDEILYHATVRQNSLTTNQKTCLTSKRRTTHRTNYKIWHRSTKKDNLYMEFPLLVRHFYISDKIAVTYYNNT